MSKNNKAIMDYRLPIIKSASQINETNNKVCRKGTAIAYGISVKSLQEKDVIPWASFYKIPGGTQIPLLTT